MEIIKKNNKKAGHPEEQPALFPANGKHAASVLPL